jgi:hypothetical protein
MTTNDLPKPVGNLREYLIPKMSIKDAIDKPLTFIKAERVAPDGQKPYWKCQVVDEHGTIFLLILSQTVLSQALESAVAAGALPIKGVIRKGQRAYYFGE